MSDGLTRGGAIAYLSWLRERETGSGKLIVDAIVEMISRGPAREAEALEALETIRYHHDVDGSANYNWTGPDDEAKEAYQVVHRFLAGAPK